MKMSRSAARVAVRVLISGNVQGVFFRSTMKSIAEMNGVVGWVRNLPSGIVEAIVQGKEGDVGRVLEWCNRGPERANVTNVLVEKIAIDESYRNFAILY